MRQSQLFTRTRHEAPAGEEAKNAQLLARAGFIHKEVAGAYTFLPLGLRVLENIADVVREEMDMAGGQEMRLTALQDPELWKATDRWDDDKVDVWFKTELKAGGDLGLGITHEEPLTNLAKNHIRSYRDVPVYPYQIQTKFRNEVRAKSGILRGREFLMKDLYSFSKDENEHNEFYEKMKQVYHNVFTRLGIGEQTFLTFASGGSFSQFSHEFQTLSEAGEDTIYLDRDKDIAVNEEVYTDEVLAELGLEKDKLEKLTAAETGNIFTLGTKFSEPLGLMYDAEDGSEQPVFMGSYGIGISRVMGVIAELLSDDKGLVWPAEIAPFEVHVLVIGEDYDTFTQAQALYLQLQERGIDVLYDDREAGAGEKFADADLIGIPWRFVVSDRSLEAGGVEIKRRDSEETEIISVEEVLNRFH